MYSSRHQNTETRNLNSFNSFLIKYIKNSFFICFLLVGLCFYPPDLFLLLKHLAFQVVLHWINLPLLSGNIFVNIYARAAELDVEWDFKFLLCLICVECKPYNICGLLAVNSFIFQLTLLISGNFSMGRWFGRKSFSGGRTLIDSGKSQNRWFW